MPRRNKQELMAEFLRLNDAFEAMTHILCELDPALASEREFIPTRQDMLVRIDAKDATVSQMNAGVMQAINDYAIGYEFASETEKQSFDVFLGQYQQQTGRDFFVDAGRPATKAKAIVHASQITNETEYHILNACLVNLDQTVLTNTQRDKAEVLVAAYQKDRRI